MFVGLVAKYLWLKIEIRYSSLSPIFITETHTFWEMCRIYIDLRDGRDPNEDNSEVIMPLGEKRKAKSLKTSGLLCVSHFVCSNLDIKSYAKAEW